MSEGYTADYIRSKSPEELSRELNEMANRGIRAANEVLDLRRERASQAEQIAGMGRALDGIVIYGDDTLSGPAGRPHDLQWYRDGIIQIVSDARAAKAAYDATQRKPTDG